MKNNNVITNSAEFGLIPQRDFFDKDIAVEGNTDKYYIIGRGDFVYNPRKSTTAPYGPFNCYQGEEEGIVSPLYTCLKPLYPEMADYLLWYFRSPAWYSYIYHNGAQGGARHDRVGMTNDLMDGIPVNLPCKSEQKKISEFLTLLDKRINAQQQLVEALKSYKRGALAKLFPKKGASVPECRFAGFSGDWEQRKLGEILSLLKDGTHGTHKDSKNGVYLLSAKNIKDGQILIDEDLERKISFEEFEAIHSNFKLKTNDVLLTIVGSIGETAILKNPQIATFQRSVAFLRPNDTTLSSFLKTEIDTDKFQKELEDRKSQSAQPGVYLGELEKIPFCVTSIQEQRQIGSFFTHLDALITLHQQKMVAYEEIKQGLMQELFI